MQHSLNVYDCLKIGIETAGLQGVYSEETIALVPLMHDLCKVNYYKKGFRNVKDEETGQWYKKEVYEVDEKFPCGEHADKSAIILQNFIQTATAFSAAGLISGRSWKPMSSRQSLMM